MKYRVQFLVSANRLPDVVAAAFGGKLDYDPEMKLWPASQPKTPERAGYAATRKMIDENLYKENLYKEPAPKRSGSNKRGELIEASLKTGPKRWKELRTALSAGGLSESSLNNLIGIWKKQGKIRRSEDGLWSLIDGPTQAANAG
jgi:hypothetical protein